MSRAENNRLEAGSRWYLEEQLDFDRQLLAFRFATIEPWLRGPRGLELGPAEGLMSRELAAAFDHLTVVEGSSTLLAEIPAAANLTKVHALFEDFAPREPFDTVVAYYVLEHVADPEALLRRIRGWLAPGGRLIVGVPNAASLHRLAAVKMELLASPDELNPRDLALGHRRVYAWPQLAEQLERAGLRVVARLGVFLKPLANAQIEAQWTPAMIRGFYELGKDFPDHAADLVAVCEAG
jgi:2-polyprenyl-3-methyl-5-hydroxy-6-metoxy-1,4-benzoquinol methylase